MPTHPTSETILRSLCTAYDGELRDAGVVMYAFGIWKRDAERGEVEWSLASAIAMLEEDIRIAEQRGAGHDVKLLREWIGRLRECQETSTTCPDCAGEGYKIVSEEAAILVDDKPAEVCPTWRESCYRCRGKGTL